MMIGRRGGVRRWSKGVGVVARGIGYGHRINVGIFYYRRLLMSW